MFSTKKPFVSTHTHGHIQFAVSEHCDICLLWIVLRPPLTILHSCCVCVCVYVFFCYRSSFYLSRILLTTILNNIYVQRLSTSQEGMWGTPRLGLDGGRGVSVFCLFCLHLATTISMQTVIRDLSSLLSPFCLLSI